MIHRVAPALLLAAGLALGGCSITSDSPVDMATTVSGDYKAVAGCVFDELEAKDQGMHMAQNDMRRRVRIWLDNGIVMPHHVYEVTFIDRDGAATDVEARVVASLYTRMIQDALKACQPDK